MNESMLIERIRDNKRRPVGVLVARYVNSFTVAIGWSLCAKRDRQPNGCMNYKKSLALASDRCLAMVAVSQNPNEVIPEVPDVPWSIEAQYDKFRDRTVRYFQDVETIVSQVTPFVKK